MAKVRAYKIAEELGIERNEFVEKARAAGVELRNAMASLDEEQAELLREKLGAKARKGPVTEARVERKGGTAVIRRRKRRAAAEPAPSEEAAPAATGGEAARTEEPGPAAAEPAAAPAGEEAAPEVPAGPAPEPSPEPPGPEPAAPEGPQPVAARGKEEEARPAAPRPEGERGPPAPAERKGKQRKQFREVVNLREQEQIARQVTSRTTGRTAPPSVDPRAFTPPRRKRRDQPQKKPAPSAPPKAEKRVVRVEGEISVAELAKQLGAKAPEIQGKLMALGTMVTLHQTVDVPTAEKVAQDYGFDVQDVGFQEAEYLEGPEEESKEENLRPRPAVVTVMGHVDHGKTSLLDAVRKANVVSGEAGGITQHIGAYQAQHGDHVITFIDTPGHEAFTAMRARGAEVTDVVILVVAASEGIMPQTVEAIDHAKAAGVPIVVAINKCDLPDANPQLARQRLMEHGLVTEEFGGDVLAVEVSATKRTGLDALLEAVSLQAEMLEPKADPTRRAKGVVLEAKLEKGRGPVATVLVREGTLHRSDPVVVGTVFGRVRAMQNERGESLKEAGPSTPVQVVGLSGVPDAGEPVHAVESERVAKEIVAHREDQQRAQPAAPKPKVSLEELFAQAEGEGPKELNVIIKADTQGSAEALRESLLKLPSDKVKLNVLHTAVGAVSESDVQLAQASGAIVVGFHVRPDGAARKAAENAGVDVRLYQVIYEAIDEIRGAMAGLLPPTVKEVTLGSAEVRQTFTIPRVGTIAGCYVTEGMVRRNARARVVRDGVQVWQGRLGSLKRFKDDVREVQSGYECGIGLEGFNDVKVGDRIESFEHEERPAEL